MDFELCMLADKEVLTPEQADEYINKGWIYEPKIDGSRTLWVNGVLLNRRGIDTSKQYPHIKIDNEKTITDGEIAYLKEGVFNFNEGRRKENWNKCVYVVWDILQFEGTKITDKPLKERKEYLKKLKGKNFILIDDLNSSCSKEGFMIKNPLSRYFLTRSNEWRKVKYTKKAVVDFTGYEDNDDGSITAYNEENYRVKVGKDIDKAKWYLDNEGKCSIEVNYLELTENKRFRQITFSKIMEGGKNEKM